MRVFAVTGNPERPGNEALVRRGAFPAPTELSRLFAEPPQQGEVKTEATDALSLITPLIIDILQEPKTATQVSRDLALVLKQAQLWLDILVRTGAVVKEKSKYRARRIESENLLLPLK